MNDKRAHGWHSKRVLMQKRPPRCPMCDALMRECLCHQQRTFREIWDDYLKQFDTERKQDPFDLKM
jgi:DTW domain-containing protein YfiP